jgi:mannose/fructose/N-acetylgalactosamine-specific phosphotransferase system component IIB
MVITFVRIDDRIIHGQVVQVADGSVIQAILITLA